MRWTVGLMFLFLLVAGYAAESGPNARPTAAPEEDAHLAAAVNRHLMPEQPYRFVLKVAVDGDKPASSAGDERDERYFVGTVTGRDWTITGRMKEQTYHLVSRGEILTLRMDGRDVAVPSSMHGLYSPRDHLGLVRRYLNRATPTSDVPAIGRVVPAVRIDVPPADVAALLRRALGPAFADRVALGDVERRARVTYVLGIDPDRPRVAVMRVIVQYAGQARPLQHVLEYRFLEG